MSLPWPFKHVPGYGLQPTGWIYESLIRPPAFAPVTSMMTRTTGIRPQDVASARTVDQVLAELDAAGDSVRRARGAVAGRCC
jgi:DNA polymerase-3 subunit epsilon